MTAEFNISEDFRKIYQGAYDYFEKSRKYAEEIFEIYHDEKNLLYLFKAEVSGRAPNGEFLIINVSYKVTERFQPVAISVKKNMGKHTTLELYNFDYTINYMMYKFISHNMLGEINLFTKQGFHVATPAICTSLLFFRSKKFQNAVVNNYKILISDNQWDLSYNLRMADLSLERISHSPLKIIIKGQDINAVKYRLSQLELENETNKDSKPQCLEIYLSKHLTIPYRIDDLGNQKVLEIQYFNTLSIEEE